MLLRDFGESEPFKTITQKNEAIVAAVAQKLLCFECVCNCVTMEKAKKDSTASLSRYKGLADGK